MKKLTPKLTDNPRLPHESFRVVLKNNHAIQSCGNKISNSDIKSSRFLDLTSWKSGVLVHRLCI